MSENTTIEWADHTFNPWEGCQKVGPGCDHCYAEARNARYNGGAALNWGPGAPRRRTSPANWRKPLRWSREAAAFRTLHGRRQRVFCASLADVFDNAVDPHWREDLLGLIHATPELDWLLLTKRIGNARRMLGELFLATKPKNLWVGATIVNQEEADRDIPKLLELDVAVRFLSCEPLLGPIDLTNITGAEKSREYGSPVHGWSSIWRNNGLGRAWLDWVIVGGESGPGARPMHPDWARSLRDQCAAAGVAFHFKQWGEWGPDEGPLDQRDRNGIPRDPVMEGLGPCAVYAEDRWQTFASGYAVPIELCSGHGEVVYRWNKRRAGRLLDGRTHDAFPG